VYSPASYLFAPVLGGAPVHRADLQSTTPIVGDSNTWLSRMTLPPLLATITKALHFTYCLCRSRKILLYIYQHRILWGFLFGMRKETSGEEGWDPAPFI
jgi:hypothetical protein